MMDKLVNIYDKLRPQASAPEGPKARSPRNCHQWRSDVKFPPLCSPQSGFLRIEF
jgi:hypothetical protein